MSSPLDGDSSHSIDFKQPDSFSLKEILQADPSKSLSRRRVQKLGVGETVNSTMLVNENTVAIGA